MAVYKNILELIGNTPILELSQLNTGISHLFIKLESQNPGGSIKDRVGLNMIEQAEKKGKIHKGDLIVEATAGNTGLGLALASRQKGYNLLLVIPDKMSREKINHLNALGVETVITRSDVGKGHPEYYQDLALRLSKERGGFYINQFENPDNPSTHELHTGPEIWKQLEHHVDAVVVGVGSSGTLSGLTAFFKKVSPQTEFILADPQGSVLADFINTHKLHTTSASWRVEGIGEDYVPKLADFELVREAYAISDEESFNAARELLQVEGVLAGSSTGTLLAAALKYCRKQKTPKRVITLACDSGNKYLSKMYNNEWLASIK
ncbi:MAG TPA: PLP-dependent cysteine synthase family protein [Paludibacteraceae bacterium]|nr:PLP-dependent cysteine synthase family protein [Paludibacteraceae bacterium]HQF51154.1 PLP-dependent cysteine synthase family protein [Paludibacteraceae bacterium]